MGGMRRAPPRDHLDQSVAAPHCAASDDLKRARIPAHDCVRANLYDAHSAIPEPESFDRVYVTWGALGWLPDIEAWARIVAYFLRRGGSLYLAEGHPAAWVFDDQARGRRLIARVAP
jgi:hypothetical protein